MPAVDWCFIQNTLHHCLRASNSSGELRDIGTARINLAVKPILVRNLAIDCRVTVIEHCSANLVHNLDGVKPGRQSTKLSIACCASVVIFSPLCPPYLFGLSVGSSCLRTIACPVPTGSLNFLAADEIEIFDEGSKFSWRCALLQGRVHGQKIY